MGGSNVPKEMIQVVEPPHPLIKHWVSVLRDENTPSHIFRSAMAELGRLLIYEATRDWMPTIIREVKSPVGVSMAEFINPKEPILVVPILRAGLALAEHAPSVLPCSRTNHLGMARDEKTLLPSVYLNKLPDKFSEGARILLVDPMLATAGTISAAIDLLKDRGVQNAQIKVASFGDTFLLISAMSCPPALQKQKMNFPGLQVYTGAIDPILNEKGFIVPGLGDAGDRSYGT